MWLAIIILIILIWLYTTRACETLVNKPDETQVQQMTQELMSNKEVMSKSYSDAKYHFNWIDPVTFEKARFLYRDNNFNQESIQNIFI